MTPPFVTLSGDFHNRIFIPYSVYQLYRHYQPLQQVKFLNLKGSKMLVKHQNLEKTYANLSVDFQKVQEQRVDVLIVHGSSFFQPAIIAADLWKKGIVDKGILVLGGRNRKTGLIEALTYGLYLAYTVPDAPLWLEGVSTNSMENAIMGKTILTLRLELASLETFGVVGVSYALQRQIGTDKRWIADGQERYTFIAYGFEPMWFRDEVGNLTDDAQAIIWKEAQKVEQRIERGHASRIKFTNGVCR